jgi:hypothetical protein
MTAADAADLVRAIRSAVCGRVASAFPHHRMFAVRPASRARCSDVLIPSSTIDVHTEESRVWIAARSPVHRDFMEPEIRKSRSRSGTHQT